MLVKEMVRFERIYSVGNSNMIDLFAHNGCEGNQKVVGCRMTVVDVEDWNDFRVLRPNTRRTGEAVSEAFFSNLLSAC